jgi:hypothetical protein
MNVVVAHIESRYDGKAALDLSGGDSVPSERVSFAP